MNPIDILARNFPSLTDAQKLRDSSVTPDTSEGVSIFTDADSFESLLQELAGPLPRSGDSAQRAADPEQHGLVADCWIPETSGTGVENALVALLQEILPKPDARTAGPSNVGGQEGEATSPILRDGMPQSQDESELVGLTKTPKIAIAVRHQETHFKPVIQNVEAGRQVEDISQIRTVSDIVPAEESAHKSSSLAIREEHGLAKVTHVSDLPSHRTQAPAEPVAQSENAKSAPAHQQAITRPDEHSDTDIVPSVKSGANAEVVPLPSETLDGIASAVKSDLRTIIGSSPAQPSPGREGVRVISVKASDSALRILNLQLHPADLGMVTIKMRLAGDSLEMELHVEREDTAQLLRHDSEKLSALLRGSGYRPDTISVHVADASIQDRASVRAQSDVPMQGQSFQQGGTSQGGRSRDQEKHYAKARSEYHKNSDEDQMLDGPRTGGVYL